MNRRILAILMIMLICIALFPLSVEAENTSVSASYESGVAAVTGTGFTNGSSYTVRVVDTQNSSIKAMGQAVANGNGAISASITTGSLGPIGNYAVYVNNQDGTLAASDNTIDVRNNSGGGSNSGGNTTPTPSPTPAPTDTGKGNSITVSAEVKPTESRERKRIPS